MIIEVCLVLRIILNEQQHFSVEQLSASPCKATKEPGNSRDLNRNVAGSNKDLLNINSDSGASPQLNSLWVYRPASQAQESNPPNDFDVKQVMMKPAHSLTRLAKSLTLGFDPVFSKGYFEPFEKRPKPVTLVAFRKNGLVPRSQTKMADGKSREIAELQSPYNDVSNFWVD